MSTTDRVLIVSAFAPELAPLKLWLAGRAAWKFRTKIHALPVGIGAIDAATGAAMAITRTAPRAVLFIGTAGSYGPRPAIGDVAIAARIRLVSTAAVRGQGYLPKPMPAIEASSTTLRRELLLSAGLSGEGVDVAAPLGITTAVRLAALIAKTTHTAVENLEVFGVARAATRARVPFGAILGITNRVGPKAHAEWMEHQATAAASACAVAAAWIEDRFARGTGARHPRG